MPSLQLPKITISAKVLCTWFALCSLSLGQTHLLNQEGELKINQEAGQLTLRVKGDKDEAWVFDSSTDLQTWTRLTEIQPVYSDHNAEPMTNTGTGTFCRARAIADFYDPSLVQTIELTFVESDWLTIMEDNYATATFLNGDITFQDYTYEDVGIRFKGNSSYRRAGDKRSIAIETEFTTPDLELLDFDDHNYNNAFNDESLMREALYFNSIKEYVITPNAGFIKILINGENWGVYSNAQQQDGSLLDEWFGNADGDRWKSPSGTGAGGAVGGGGGGGGGGFASGDKALLYLGANPATYQAIYELKTQNSVDPWAHMISAASLLDTTSPLAANYRETMDAKFNVDRWLWFLAAENIFTDDDSYWHKGADYQIYYEPDSGQLHPIEHDGNEAFTVSEAALDPMYYDDNPNRPVLSKFLANPELRQRYLAHFRTILNERFNPTHLHALIDEYEAVIATEVALDPKKDFTVAEFQTDIANLKTHITNRYNFLTAHTEIAQNAPTITNVSEPVGAVPGTPVPITATVTQHASDGVASVRLYYRQGSSGQFVDVEMFDDGANGDGAAADGVYGASAIGYIADRKMHYYIEAISGNAFGSAKYSPARAELEPYKYEVGTITAPTTSVVINEFMALNDTFLADPQGDFDDWIELHNLESTEVDLSGMYLSDNSNNPRKWEIPAGTTIPANGYLIVWADENGSDTPGLHANFRLSGSGEEILLVDSDANLNAVLDSVVYPSATTDISIGRSVADPNIFESMTPTPGADNL